MSFWHGHFCLKWGFVAACFVVFKFSGSRLACTPQRKRSSCKQNSTDKHSSTLLSLFWHTARIWMENPGPPLALRPCLERHCDESRMHEMISWRKSSCLERTLSEPKLVDLHEIGLLSEANYTWVKTWTEYNIIIFLIAHAAPWNGSRHGSKFSAFEMQGKKNRLFPSEN